MPEICPIYQKINRKLKHLILLLQQYGEKKLKQCSAVNLNLSKLIKTHTNLHTQLALL